MIDVNVYKKIMEEARRFCEESDLASSTVAKKLGALDRLWRGIGEIWTETIQDWLCGYKNPRTGTPLGPHGMNNYIIEIRWYLRRTTIEWLHEGGKEILRKLKRRKAKPGGKYVDATEFERVVQFAPSDAHELAFRLMRECAFRPHELLSIKVGDVATTRIKSDVRYDRHGNRDNDRGNGLRDSPKRKNPHNVDKTGNHHHGPNAPAIPAIIRLSDENPVTPSRKNKTGARVVPVIETSEDLLARVEKIRKKEGEDGRIFPWNHSSLSSVYCRMKRACIDLSNVPVNSDGNGGDKRRFVNSREPATKTKKKLGRLYDLRHTAITDMYRKGLSDQIVRQVVGWTPASKMPNVYVHITEAHLHESYGRLQALRKDFQSLRKPFAEPDFKHSGWKS